MGRKLPKTSACRHAPSSAVVFWQLLKAAILIPGVVYSGVVFPKDGGQLLPKCSEVLQDAKETVLFTYGAAIDLNPRFADYWQWSSNLTNPTWRKRIPTEIVRIFEKQGFVWGGYWYHFEAMHFEYRTELL